MGIGDPWLKDHKQKLIELSSLSSMPEQSEEAQKYMKKCHSLLIEAKLMLMEDTQTENDIYLAIIDAESLFREYSSYKSTETFDAICQKLKIIADILKEGSNSALTEDGVILNTSILPKHIRLDDLDYTSYKFLEVLKNSLRAISDYKVVAQDLAPLISTFLLTSSEYILSTLSEESEIYPIISEIHDKISLLRTKTFIVYTLNGMRDFYYFFDDLSLPYFEDSDNTLSHENKVVLQLLRELSNAIYSIRDLHIRMGQAKLDGNIHF